MRPLEQQLVLVTGATDGIGERIARNLVERGATVLLHGRSQERAEAAGARIADAGPGRWEPVVADLASFAQVRDLAAQVAGDGPLDALVNNAGIGYGSTAPPRGARTEDGHEPTWQVNVLSPFLLTTRLHDSLAAGGGGRVVHMSSGMQSGARVDLDAPDAPDGVDPYRQSKLALVMLAREMGERWRADGIDVNAVDPGWIATKMGGPGGGDIGRGADTATWLVTDPALDGTTGGYFADRREQRPNPQADDAEARGRLWALAGRAVAAPGESQLSS
jgi:NAD(P)-dependent dehydrogenase (short-subunit alcohol dehydrogenase family)